MDATSPEFPSSDGQLVAADTKVINTNPSQDESSDSDDDSDESHLPASPKGNKGAGVSEDGEGESDSSEGEGDDVGNSSGKRDPIIHGFILRGDVDAVKMLLAAAPSMREMTDWCGRTPLHVALLRGLPEMVKVILDVEDPVVVERVLRQPFQAGRKEFLSAFHLALNEASVKALECIGLLCPHGQVDSVDDFGRTALHMACKQGSPEIVKALLANRADPHLEDDLGSFPLHYAIDSRSLQCVQQLMCVDRSLFEGEKHPLRRCVERQAWGVACLIHKGWVSSETALQEISDLAARRGCLEEWNFVRDKGSLENANSLEQLSWPTSVAPTAVVTHPLCGEHGLMPYEVDDLLLQQQIMTQTPENPHRLEVLCGKVGILRSPRFQALKWVDDPPAAPLVDVLRVHEYWYVHKLMERVRQVKEVAVSPFQKLPLDGGDTKVTVESWNAALRASGAVIDAVKRVCDGEVRNAFCAVRPPGHHLGPCGACNSKDLEDDPEGSQGFCLLNNVAIGAAFARCVYRHLVHRVAIVDFDVHHGNGTEAVVRHLLGKTDSEKSVAVRGFSLALKPPPSCKPWLDPESDVEEVFFASIHGYGGGFYPGTGAACSETSPRIINVALRPGSDSSDFRHGMRSRILPDMLAFDPDIIFVSAGFDGHESDLIGNCQFMEDDFVWATEELMGVARRCCQGRLVSVLEGGYNTRAEALSPFAQSVAAHVSTLMHSTCRGSDLTEEACLALKRVDEQRVVRLRTARRTRQQGQCNGTDSGGTHRVKRPRIEEDSQHGKDVSMVPGEMSIGEAEQLQMAFGTDDEFSAAACAVPTTLS